MKGFIHIYCGDGKGKTTAAVGLAVRASADGKKILFSQFLKDGTSGELTRLKQIEEITVLPEEQTFGFTFSMTEEEFEQAEAYYNQKLCKIISIAKNYDMVILDEFMAAYNKKLIDNKIAIQFLKEKPEALEIVLTGRNPDQSLLKMADYVTEMKKIKHPFDSGISARKGIEY
ncbi:cob(I)yrinic acid a,c-diamide adenosyltransferase [Velocimicrobium porci]|uniref:Cob(I)yrinic acid a,c-diamide adenosyltransferase n=1 Tax=Velocimicrobium porci TaxID=2606634 RepID=A0A6L5Y1S8_9FIRM|nr:cob(I)yrinic acid a,c-diamide adenosyltransferase [Velocimicrobium porci]MSS64952.1 cob(I)yrinic acid a,c-diamide adenosyltransferase [Velocimicrobium porci]